MHNSNMRKWLKLDKSEKIDKVSKQIPSEPIPVDHVVFAKYERVFPDHVKGVFVNLDSQGTFVFVSKEAEENFAKMTECEKKYVLNALSDSMGKMYIKICEEILANDPDLCEDVRFGSAPVNATMSRIAGHGGLD